jgi:hypothetical protein
VLSPDLNIDSIEPHDLLACVDIFHTIVFLYNNFTFSDTMKNNGQIGRFHTGMRQASAPARTVHSSALHMLVFLADARVYAKAMNASGSTISHFSEYIDTIMQLLMTIRVTGDNQCVEDSGNLNDPTQMNILLSVENAQRIARDMIRSVLFGGHLRYVGGELRMLEQNFAGIHVETLNHVRENTLRVLNMVVVFLVLVTFDHLPESVRPLVSEELEQELIGLCQQMQASLNSVLDEWHDR